MTDALDRAVADAAAILADAERIAVSTGAGMSAESGVPTFRDSQTGYWAKFDPAELATPEAFARDPEHVWGWYRMRRAELQKCEPHAGHRVLADWEQRAQLTLITQNVDGLHHRAGSHHVIELHGRLDRAYCVACDNDVVGLDDLGPDPRCDACGQRLRPGVVWFGEMLPPGAIEAASAAVEACDVLLVIGTSGVVEPAASLARLAQGGGAKLIEINPDPTPTAPRADVWLATGCKAALTALDEAWLARS